MMRSFSVFIAIALSSGIIWAQETTRLHRIDTKSPEGLRELLRFDGTSMPLLSSHRGGAVSGYPENCIATFEHTLGQAFSMLEIDLRFSKDGEIVLHHDPTLDRTTTGSGPVAERTLSELRELKLRDVDGEATEYSMPTLDEALQWARGKTILVLDKKEVPVEVCVKKIQQHQAHAYAMIMAYNIEEIKTCYRLDPNIMMEVMIGNHNRLNEFDQSGVPWHRVIAFVGHAPPNDKELVNEIHSRGALCMAGTSRNLDLRLRDAKVSEHDKLRVDYRQRLEFGIDVLETDLPVQVGTLLYSPAKIPDSKSDFFRDSSH